MIKQSDQRIDSFSAPDIDVCQFDHLNDRAHQPFDFKRFVDFNILQNRCLVLTDLLGSCNSPFTRKPNSCTQATRILAKGVEYDLLANLWRTSFAKNSAALWQINSSRLHNSVPQVVYSFAKCLL